MARLNESTASTEPIEILKRRFVRQNREIARVNSIQSLRIRSLESEVSHLLSENVSLREQIIALTQDLERFEAAKTLHDGVYDVKARLDSKLVELSSLITELGSLPRRYAKKTRDEPEPMGGELPRDTDFTQPVKDANLDRALELEANGKLPVILEDKYFPRRTLSAQELQEVSNSDTDIPSCSGSELSAKSPIQDNKSDDLPIKSPIGYTNTSTMVGYAENERPLPPNLETRRKKRPGPISANEVHGDTNSTSLLDSRFTRKCGAKRKFSAEDEETFFESVAIEDDDFKFNRPAQSPVRLSPQNSHSPPKKKTGPKEAAKSHVQPKRKVLEPKSTNRTIFSPTKSSTTKIQDKYQNPTMVGSNENSIPKQTKDDQSRNECSSPKKPSTPMTGNDTEMDYDKQEVKIEVGRDTMQFHDIQQPEIPTTPDMPNTRPSRRRGAVVSYAEPNLRDKMRRSTNELGPAVSGDRSRKSSSHTDSNWEPHEQSGNKSSSLKKAWGSEITNQGHDLVGDKPPGEHLKRNLNASPEKKPQSSTQHNDGGKEDAEGQAQEQYVPGGRELEDQFGSMPYRGDSVQNNHSLSVHSRSDISMDVDQAALITTRKSRRHSSNTKSSGRNTMPRYCTSVKNAESLYNNLATTCSGSDSSNSELSMFPTKVDTFTTRDPQENPNTLSLMGSTGTGRGQRIATRRRSMVL